MAEPLTAAQQATRNDEWGRLREQGRLDEWAAALCNEVFSASAMDEALDDLGPEETDGVGPVERIGMILSHYLPTGELDQEPARRFAEKLEEIHPWLRRLVAELPRWALADLAEYGQSVAGEPAARNGDLEWMRFNGPVRRSLRRARRPEQVWAKVSTRLRAALPPATFEAFFADAAGVELRGGTLVVELPDDRTRQWVNGHFLRVVEAAAQAASPLVCRVALRARPGRYGPDVEKLKATAPAARRQPLRVMAAARRRRTVRQRPPVRARGPDDPDPEADPVRAPCAHPSDSSGFPGCGGLPIPWRSP